MHSFLRSKLFIGEQTREVSRSLYKIPPHEGAAYLGLLVTYFSSKLSGIYEKGHPRQKCTCQGHEEKHKKRPKCLNWRKFSNRLVISGRDQVGEAAQQPRTVVHLHRRWRHWNLKFKACLGHSVSSRPAWKLSRTLSQKIQTTSEEIA